MRGMPLKKQNHAPKNALTLLQKGYHTLFYHNYSYSNEGMMKQSIRILHSVPFNRIFIEF